MSLDRSRFGNFISDEVIKDISVMVIGCGGIGSYAAPLLAKMGVTKFTLVDFDEVEEANIATQNYDDMDLYAMKVQALKDKLERVNEEVRVQTQPTKFEEGTYGGHDVVVLAVDSLKARLAIHDVMFPEWRLLVDPRMGLEVLEVHTLQRHDDMGGYMAHLKDGGAVDLPCGAKAIAYTGAVAGAAVASIVRRWLCGEEVPRTMSVDCGRLEG